MFWQKALKAFVFLCALVSITTGNSTAQDSSSTSTVDTTFISFNGKFYINYPSRWKMIDFQTVDFYQEQTGQVLDYEGVFAPPDAAPFFQKDYLVLQVDTIGPLVGDSVEPFLKTIERQANVKIDRRESVNIATDLQVEGIIFDKSQNVLWNLTELRDRDNNLKRTLIAEILYERGIARFIFYTPESDYLALLPSFIQVVKSFGSENYQAKLPKSEVVIADTTAINRDKNGKTNYVLPIAVAIAIITAVIFAQRRKKS